MLNGPSLALIGPDGAVVHSTAAFRHEHGDADRLEELPSELKRVLSGKSDSAELALGNQPFTAEALVDGEGERRALLSAGDEMDGAAADPVAELRDALEESPVITWLKDLEGRYLYLNPVYTQELGTEEERLLGQTDDAVSPKETVDGPRIALGEEVSPEPRQLEYTVPAYDDRPALAAWRIVLRDSDGQPLATCGVAAPLDRAQLAREETARLMELERWRTMDRGTVVSEVLAEWGLAGQEGSDPTMASAADPHVGPPGETNGAAPAAGGENGWSGDYELDLQNFQALRDTHPGNAPEAPATSDLERRWNETLVHLQSEAHLWRQEIGESRYALAQAQTDARSAQEELESARAEVEELKRALAKERERIGGVLDALGQVQARIADLDGTEDPALAAEAS